MKEKALRISFFVPTFNAGETTRGVELAKALREMAAAQNREIEISFHSVYKAVKNFEAQILKAGFPIRHKDIGITDSDISSFMKADHQAKEFVPDEDRARNYIESGLASLAEFQPDLVVHGFVPPVGISVKISNIPSVSFLPMPPSLAWAQKHLIKDIPDPLDNWLTARFPLSLRKMLIRFIAKQIPKQPFFAQSTLVSVGRRCGWRTEAPHLFGMLAGDMQIVNDLPDFYAGQDIGPHCRITGPLFSRSSQKERPQAIAKIMASDNPNRIFISMGSSGEKHYLLEAIRAVAGASFNVVAVVPPIICSLQEVRTAVTDLKNIHLTDEFVASQQINTMAQVAIIHGGQGTVQTALFSGTPMVGVAMQAEQQTNLDNIANKGAGIRIPKRSWNAKTIRKAVRLVLNRPGFKENATTLQKSFHSIDGRQEAARVIWEFVEEKGL